MEIFVTWMCFSYAMGIIYILFSILDNAFEPDPREMNRFEFILFLLFICGFVFVYIIALICFGLHWLWEYNFIMKWFKQPMFSKNKEK